MTTTTENSSDIIIKDQPTIGKEVRTVTLTPCTESKVDNVIEIIRKLEVGRLIALKQAYLGYIENQDEETEYDQLPSPDLFCSNFQASINKNEVSGYYQMIGKQIYALQYERKTERGKKKFDYVFLRRF